MKCKQCFAEEPIYFYKGSCRRCIYLKSDKIVFEPLRKISEADLNFPITLTNYQVKTAMRLAEAIKHTDVFLFAVCGAGKTEMCLHVVCEGLRDGKRIIWSVPRREVVLELTDRLRNYFPRLSIISVCEGFLDIFDGDIIICTTHQLHRYSNGIDILILDEPDAFPFCGNKTLLSNYRYVRAKRVILLSATKDEWVERNLITSKMEQIDGVIRPSGKLLPVPEIRLGVHYYFRFLFTYRKYKTQMCLVFVPTKKMAKFLSCFLKVPFITSASEDKFEIIKSFREKRGTLVTTTILERGVTFKDCYVFVLNSDNTIFSTSSLIQISGRVGRGMNPKKGRCIFFSNTYSQTMKQCIKIIGDMNESALTVLQE